MPNLKSVSKRVETSAKRAKINNEIKGAMNTAIKKVIKTTDVNDLRDTIKKIDKALKKGIIKKNTANRKKARIIQKLKGTK